MSRDELTARFILGRMFPGHWVTANGGRFCVMARDSAIHSSGCVRAKDPLRLMQAVEVLM